MKLLLSLLLLTSVVVRADLVSFRNEQLAESSLVSRYTFDANNANDSAATNHGTLQGAPTFATGVGGAADRALVLNGAQRVNFGNVAAFDFADGTGTLEAFVRADWAGVGYNPCIASDREGGTTRWSVHMNANKGAYGIWNGATYQPQALSGVGTAWHHMVVVFASGSVRLYWDGLLVGTTAQALGNVTVPTQLGSSASGSTAEGWIGAFDEVAFYADALDTTRVVAHYNAFLSGVPVITQQPANTTVVENGTANFSIAATPPTGLTFQWQKNDVDIGGATSANYAHPALLADSGATFRCVLTNTNGGAQTISSSATLTVQAAPIGSNYYHSAVPAEPSLLAYFPEDGTPPGVLLNTANASFPGGLVGSAVIDSTVGRIVGTHGHFSNATGYVELAKDPAWDLLDGTGTVEFFAYQSATAGYNPCMFSVRGGGPTRYSIHFAGNGSGIVFWNGTTVVSWPAPATLIGRLVHVAVVFNGAQTTCYLNGTSLGALNIGLGAALEQPAHIGSSASGAGAELFPGWMDEVAVYADALPASAIGAHYLAWQNAANGAGPVITGQPQNLSKLAGETATFGVTLQDPTGAVYRWQKNGVDLAGATAATLDYPVTANDNGAQFRCVVYSPFGGVRSQIATLSVQDTTPPTFVASQMPGSTTTLLLTFSEPVTALPANFVLSNGASVISVSTGVTPNTLVLTTTPLTPGTSYSVTMNGVVDGGGNPIAPGTVANFTALDFTPANIALLRPGSEPVGPATRRSSLTISEIHYHPPTRPDGKNLEFVEIRNTNPWPENLTGWRVSGEVNFDFPSGTTIPSKGYLVVAAVPADVQSVYGISGVLGPWTGALNNAGGTLRLRNRADGVAFEVEYDSTNGWTAGPDGTGHSLVLARPSYGMNDARSWEISEALGGSPGAAEPAAAANPWRTVMFNEVLANSAGVDFLELYNYSASAVDLSGCVLTDNPDLAKYTFPTGTSIPARGVLALTEGQLGFAFEAEGDALFLKSPTGRVLDGVKFRDQAAGVALGRTPDGAPGWRRLTTPSPGSLNAGVRRGDVVISEIMYHAISGISADEFIELRNRTGVPVNIGGWRLRGEVDFDIPNGTTIPANGYLVIARDPAGLAAQYAGLNALGPWVGSLSDGGGRISLQGSEVLGIDIIHPTVDEVVYGTGGAWAKAADGGGSSLELRDPDADGNLAPAWAASDESNRSGWKTIETTGVLDNGLTTNADSLQIFLLGGGECLVDDVEVVPNGGSNRVGNGNFETGPLGWAFQGTHRTSGVENGGVTGSALHLRATDRGDQIVNRVRTTLSSPLTSGQTVTIRAKVKWLSGAPEILLRLRGGWLEATGSMLTTTAFGTPGQANSKAVANAPIAITDVVHQPVLPTAGTVVTVYARVSDPDGIGGAILRYRVDPQMNLTTVTMQPVGAGLFAAEIPAQNNGTLVAFHVVAADGLGASSTFPTDGREGLVRWGETQPSNFDFGVYRLWVTQAALGAWNGAEKNSNTPHPCTFIYGGVRPVYGAYSLLSGSPFHTPGFSGPQGANCDYEINLPDDDRVLGETDLLITGPGTFGSDSTFIREQAIWWIAAQLRQPALNRRFVRMIINGTQRQTIFEDTQQPNGEFLEEFLPGEDDGHLHKAQDYIEMDDAGQGFVGTSRAVLGNFTTTGGAKKLARYRYMWPLRSAERSENDFGPFFTMVDAHNQANATTYTEQIAALLDVDSWMRALAVQRIAGNWDSWGWSYGKNMYAYRTPAGRWHMFPWDIDFAFGDDGTGNPDPDVATAGLFQNTSNFDGGAPGDPLASKFRNNVRFQRSYWAAFREAVDGPMVPATINARIDAIQAGLTANGITPASSAGVKTYISDRRNYILSQLGTVTTTFTVNGPTTFSTDTANLVLTGTAPVEGGVLDVNGVPLSVTWTSLTAWTGNYLLKPGLNTLVVTVRDGLGNVLGTTTLQVTYTGTASWPQLWINEWSADNETFLDPADDDANDWIEIFNPTNAPVNLTDWRISDSSMTYVIPAGYTVPAGGWLLIWADNETEQNTGSGHLHASFQLSAGGETITLRAPDTTIIDSVTYLKVNTDESVGRYPDGAAEITSQTLPSPLGANVVTRFSALSRVGNVVSFSFSTTPGYQYQGEWSENLGSWLPMGTFSTAGGTTLTLEDPAATPGKRFYRVRVSD